ncbi:MAG: PEP-CTERM sorting domain-containing protein [Verrucomicrobiae bacterium]
MIKSIICLTVAATMLMALNAPAKTVATDDANNAVQGITQSAESVVTLAKIVMGNTLGGFTVTPMAIPEPSTLALATLGGVGFLMARRRR